MNIKVIFSEANDAELPVVFSESDQSVEANFGEVQSVNITAEVYKGDYAVTPKVDEQIMPTKGKLLVDDVTINSIPFFNVSNTSGGNTVYIGT